ncbi:hypothetical protein QBC32DRAFT_367387 [Pseudoneurospora amorphoporcata]|uniref:Uncharacterized protein n=1 Tax=Pseudoneurospora amorphoporcata TaxID=241081 RepID=A0AAN6SK25_9PEZI|nr:hypothetical protein QBC32DRAFT_367387 [Pseudoneurospora amorphoporcata]
MDTLTENVNIDLLVNKATSEATIEGNITIGNKSFKIHSNPEVSDGIECNSIINDGETLVSCLAPVSNEVVQFSKVNHLTIKDYFSNGVLQFTEIMRAAYKGYKVIPYAEILREMKMAAKIIAVNKTVTKDIIANTDNQENITKRQYNPCSIWTARTILEGDGDPHQTPKYIQFSDPIDWTNGGCTILYNAVKSMSISFSVSSKLTSWISGGFSVEKSVETSNAFECQGQAYKWVVVWKVVARTLYRVRNAIYNSCTGNSPTGNVFLLTSPNSSTYNRNFYCVRGKQYVRNLGDSYNVEPGTPGKP